jgi:phosphatidylglycerol:prolipoprotein diacylglycerol transferase
MLTLYSVFRIFVEFFRQPDIQMGAGGFFAGWLTTGMLLSLPMLVGGVWLIVRARRASRTAGGDARKA